MEVYPRSRVFLARTMRPVYAPGCRVSPDMTDFLRMCRSLYTIRVPLQPMASKKKAAKPKNILEDTANAIKNAVTAFDKKPIESQNLAEYKQTVKNLLKTGATAADVYATGGLAGSFAKNVVSPGAKVGSPSSKSKAEKSGLKKFGIDVGVTASTVGAAAAAGGAINKSGVVQRLLNKATKQQVIVHGSPTPGIKTIIPKVPKANPAGTKAVYGMNPETVKPNLSRDISPNPNIKSQPLNLAQIARDYADAGGNIAGSAYVAKVPKSSITNPASIGPKSKVGIVTSKSPAKVVAEIKMAGKTEAQIQKELLSAAKKAGAKIPKTKKFPKNAR